MNKLTKTLLAVLLAVPLCANAGTVTVKGSDTMVILVQRWAEAFMKKNPDIKIQVTGGGSGTGIAALVNGTTEIAASSRDITAAEKQKVQARFKVASVETPVAKDGVAFYVNEANPLKGLTMEQLRDIYLGDVSNWKDVGGKDAKIVLYSRESSSGTYVFTKEVLLENEDFAAGAQTLPGTAAIINAVSKEPNAIGYGGSAYAKGVRDLKVKGKEGEFGPTAQNVKSGKYPLARPLYLITKGPAAGDAKKFLDFTLSDEGQKIVTEVGYFPLK